MISFTTAVYVITLSISIAWKKPISI